MLHRIFSIASLSYFKAPTAFATGSNLSSLRRFPAPLVRSHLLPRTRTYSMQMDLDIPAIKDGQTIWGNFELGEKMLSSLYVAGASFLAGASRRVMLSDHVAP